MNGFPGCNQVEMSSLKKKLEAMDEDLKDKERSSRELRTQLEDATEKKVPHLQTLIIDKSGFTQSYFRLTFILLTKIVLCSKYP